MGECIFCKIARGEIPSQVVHDDEDTFAFVDLNPQAPLHILVIPKVHIPKPQDIQEAHRSIIGRLFQVAAAIARGEGVEQSGYRLVVNSGPEAGQIVDHLHVHLLGGRAMSWPPG